MVNVRLIEYDGKYGRYFAIKKWNNDEKGRQRYEERRKKKN